MIQLTVPSSRIKVNQYKVNMFVYYFVKDYFVKDLMMETVSTNVELFVNEVTTIKDYIVEWVKINLEVIINYCPNYCQAINGFMEYFSSDEILGVTTVTNYVFRLD